MESLGVATPESKVLASPDEIWELQILHLFDIDVFPGSWCAQGIETIYSALFRVPDRKSVV